MDVVKIGNLYDEYSLLLTEKQRNYFIDYYFNDLSLAEIAKNSGVSRNAIFKQVKDTENKLEDYEKILHLREKKEILLNVIDLTDGKIKEQLEKLI